MPRPDGPYWTVRSKELWRLQRYHLTEDVNSMSTSAILKVVYGVDIVDENDERIVIPRAALETTRRSTPGAFVVEVFPILRHMPSWFPGAGFQKVFAECKVANEYLKHVLFDEAKEALVSIELRFLGRRVAANALNGR